jgi:hypothetical protein
MRHPNPCRMRPVSVKLLIVVILAMGCYSWKPVKLEPNPDPSARPSHIEITMRDGAQYTVYRPEVRQDSLHGWVGETGITPVAFALDDVALARARRVDGDKTAAFGIGVSLFFLLAWFLGAGMILASLE